MPIAIAHETQLEAWDIGVIENSVPLDPVLTNLIFPVRIAIRGVNPISRSGPRPGRDPWISQVTNVHDRGGCYEQVGSTNGGIAFLFVLVSSCNVQLLETTFSN